MGTSGKPIDEQTRARIVKELTEHRLSVRNVASRNGVSTRTVQKLKRRSAGR